MPSSIAKHPVQRFLFALSLSAPLAHATPAATHLASVDDVMKRLDTVTNLDAASRLGSPLANILTEPVIRALWAGQIVTDSDWIGIQALVGATYRIDPGTADDATNMFLYTCRGGWIDMGHLLHSAIAYKVIYQGLKGNPVVDLTLLNIFRGNGESAFYREIRGQVGRVLKAVQKDKALVFATPESMKLLRRSAELRLKNLYEYTGRKVPAEAAFRREVDAELRQAVQSLNEAAKVTSDVASVHYGYWAGFFAMQSGYLVEVLQNKDKKALKPEEWHGNHTSAWTLEDLPSDYYGVLMGAALERKNHQRSAIRQMKSYLKSFLTALGAVDPKDRTKGEACKATVQDVLKDDALYYLGIAEHQHVTHSVKDSSDPLSPYNYTVIPKPTRNHRCLCDAKNRPHAQLNVAGKTERMTASIDFEAARGPWTAVRDAETMEWDLD